MTSLVITGCRNRCAAARLDGGEDGQARRVVEPRPGGDFVEGAGAAAAQAGGGIHLANVDAGRLNHSDEHEAMLLVAHHVDRFEGFVAADSGEHGQMQTPVAGS